MTNDTMLQQGWTRDGQGWISPVKHPRPRKGKHDTKVWQYSETDWAAACTGCGFTLDGVDEETARDAAERHWQPGYEKPFVPEVLWTSKGHEVEVSMSDEEAARLLAGRTSDFARDLAAGFAKYGSWTAGQRPWAHLLANEAQGEKGPEADEPKAPVHTFAKLAAFMGRAGERLSYPAVRLADWLEIKYMTGGKNEGKILVTDGGKYPDNEFYGYIEADGSYDPPSRTPDHVLEALAAFDADPQGEAASYGRETGSCCFCRRQLTTTESVSVGYGPVCADKYGLPWG